MIREKTLRNMQGEITINETRGYLFENGDIIFAYRIGRYVAADTIEFKDRLLIKKSGDRRLTGYYLSGIPVKDSSCFERKVPIMPSLNCVPTREDFETFEGRVIVYGDRPSVVLNGVLVWRDIDILVDAEGRPEQLSPLIGAIKHINKNRIHKVMQTKLYRDKHEYLYEKYSSILTRNGIR